jgi:uncharacterized protein
MNEEVSTTAASSPDAAIADATAGLAGRPLAQPVAPAERVAAVDVLRGVALLGILAMNIVAFAWPFAGYEDPHYSGGADLANRLAWLINAVLFQDKMMSLFSMLFGAGLVLMSTRAAARGARLQGVYYRRIFWLLIFGLVHSYLIWAGDILVYYALCGLWLYFFRTASPRLLIALGAALIGFACLLVLALTLFAGFAERTAAEVAAAEVAGQSPDQWQVVIADIWNDGMKSFFRTEPQEVEKEITMYQRGSYIEIVRQRAPDMLMFQITSFPFYFLWAVGGRMLLGMGLMKLGVFAAARSWRFYIGLAVAGYGCGLLLTAWGIGDLLWHDFEMIEAPWGTFAFGLGTVPVALGHGAVVMLVCQADMLPWLTHRLAAVGRMALSNYLLQSLLCTTLFYGYGFGLFGKMDRVGLWGVVLAVWALQLVVSPLWLQCFRYGPAEWLWRTLTYWRVQPLRK